MQVKIIETKKSFSTVSSQTQLLYDFFIHLGDKILNVKVSKKFVDVKSHKEKQLHQKINDLRHSVKFMENVILTIQNQINEAENELHQVEKELSEREKIRFKFIDSTITLRQFTNKNGWEELRTKTVSYENSFQIFHIEKSFDDILDIFELYASVMATEYVEKMIPHNNTLSCEN